MQSGLDFGQTKIQRSDPKKRKLNRRFFYARAPPFDNAVQHQPGFEIAIIIHSSKPVSQSGNIQTHIHTDTHRDIHTGTYTQETGKEEQEAKARFRREREEIERGKRGKRERRKKEIDNVSSQLAGCQTTLHYRLFFFSLLKRKGYIAIFLSGLSLSLSLSLFFSLFIRHSTSTLLLLLLLLQLFSPLFLLFSFFSTFFQLHFTKNREFCSMNGLHKSSHVR